MPTTNGARQHKAVLRTDVRLRYQGAMDRLADMKSSLDSFLLTTTVEESEKHLVAAVGDALALA